MPLVSRISAGEGLAEMIPDLDVVTDRQGLEASVGRRADLQGDAGADLLGSLSRFLLFCCKALDK